MYSLILKTPNKQNVYLIATLLLISVIYFISSRYINTSNDGSHYALVCAIINKHSVVIDEYVKYTGHVDYAVKDGKYYSDRLPGNAFLMIPFFLFGNFLHLFHLEAISNHIPIQEVTIILLPNICGVLSLFFLFLLFRYFQISFRLSLFLTIIFALCTLTWQESTHAYSHAPSMCFVLMAVYFLIKIKNIYDKKFYLFLFLLSYSSIIELQNCLIFIPVLIYVFQTSKINFSLDVRNMKLIFNSFFIVLIPLFVLIGYNYLAFGEIMLKSNKYNPRFPEEQSFFTSLSGDFLLGLDRLFTNFFNPEVRLDLQKGVYNEIPGLFITSPVLILSLFDFLFFLKKYHKEALLFTAIITLNVLVAALHKTVLTRHIFTITPFLFFPIVFLFQTISELSRGLKILFYSIFVILSGISSFRVFYVIHTYNREITDVFPFTKEMGVYVLFFLFLGLVYLSWIGIRRMFANRLLN